MGKQISLFRVIERTSGECAAAYRAKSSEDTKCIVYRCGAGINAFEQEDKERKKKRKVSPGRESDRVLRRDGWSEVRETERRLPSL